MLVIRKMQPERKTDEAEAEHRQQKGLAHDQQQQKAAVDRHAKDDSHDGENDAESKKPRTP
jgi:hypothetical protein